MSISTKHFVAGSCAALFTSAAAVAYALSCSYWVETEHWELELVSVTVDGEAVDQAESPAIRLESMPWSYSLQLYRVDGDEEQALTFHPVTGRGGHAE